MRRLVAIAFLVAACSGTADKPAPASEPAPSTALAKWGEFASHVRVSAAEFSSITSDIGKVDDTDAHAVDALALKLQRWADSEREWLDAHPSDDCYAGTYAPWSKTVTLSGQTAKLIHDGIVERGQIKLEYAEMTQAFGELDKVTPSVPSSNDACGGTAGLPAQTAGPTASGGAASTRWEEFQDHLRDSSHEGASIASGFESGLDPSTVEAQVLKLQTWVDIETTWLDAHSPDPCYAGTYAPWSRHVTVFGQMAKLYREGITEHDLAKIHQANEAKSRAAAELQKVLDSDPISKAACT